MLESETRGMDPCGLSQSLAQTRLFTDHPIILVPNAERRPTKRQHHFGITQYDPHLQFAEGLKIKAHSNCDERECQDKNKKSMEEMITLLRAFHQHLCKSFL